MVKLDLDQAKRALKAANLRHVTSIRGSTAASGEAGWNLDGASRPSHSGSDVPRSR